MSHYSGEGLRYSLVGVNSTRALDGLRKRRECLSTDGYTLGNDTKHARH